MARTCIASHFHFYSFTACSNKKVRDIIFVLPLAMCDRKINTQGEKNCPSALPVRWGHFEHRTSSPSFSANVWSPRLDARCPPSLDKKQCSADAGSLNTN